MSTILDLMDHQHSNTLKVVETALKGIAGPTRNRVPVTDLEDFAHQGGSSSNSEQQGKARVIHPANPDAAREMNFNPPINMSFKGDLSGSDLNKVRKNMVSGKDRSGEGFVLQQISWPHQCLSKASRHILGKNVKVKHHNQTPAQFSEGMIQKIILETPKAELNPLVKNKLKFFAFITKLTYSLSWKDILSITEDFFEAIENEHIDWDSWPVIERFLKDAYEQIRFTDGFRPRSHSAPAGNPPAPMLVATTGKRWLMMPMACRPRT